MRTNIMVGNAAFTISAAGVCGASLVAVSVALSSPADNAPPQGRYAIFLTNNNEEPLHVQPRCTFTDATGTEQTIPLAIGLLSNTQAYASAQSAAQLHTLFMALCNVDVMFPLEGVAGSALQVVLMPASGIASATVVSGMCSVWRL